jgi:hypothetical protein
MPIHNCMPHTRIYHSKMFRQNQCSLQAAKNISPSLTRSNLMNTPPPPTRQWYNLTAEAFTSLLLHTQMLWIKHSILWNNIFAAVTNRWPISIVKMTVANSVMMCRCKLYHAVQCRPALQRALQRRDCFCEKCIKKWWATVFVPDRVAVGGGGGAAYGPFLIFLRYNNTN